MHDIELLLIILDRDEKQRIKILVKNNITKVSNYLNASIYVNFMI